MLKQHIGGSLEIYRLATRVHILHIVEEAGGAASATDDHVFKLGHLVQHIMFDTSETLFALFVKNLLDGFAHTALDIPVEVVESQPQVFGQCLAHGGFSRPHISYDDDALHKRYFFFTGVALTISIHCS